MKLSGVLVIAGFVAFVGVPVALTAQSSQSAQAKARPPANPEYPVRVTLADRPGDAITSDGKGSYSNGTDGVTAIIQGSQLLLKFGAVKGKYPRSINYAYTTTVGTTCDEVTGDNPVGSAASSNYVDVLNIAGMSVGAVVAKQGAFRAPIGTFRFHDATKLDPVNPYHCGALLVVTRSNATMWVVTTDTVPGATYFNSAGTPVYTANPEEVGNTAQLDVDASGQFLGNYRMPFFMTVTCLSATACPASGG